MENKDEQRMLMMRIDKLIQVLEAQTQRFDDALRALVSSLVPMAPRASRTIVVGTTATLLVENNVSSLMRIEITNDDFAQAMYVGNRDVIIPAGRSILPQDTVAFDLRKGQKLYGVISVGTINAIVSDSESALASVLADGPIVM